VRNNRITVADLIDLARSTLVLNQNCSEPPLKSFFNSIDQLSTFDQTKRINIMLIIRSWRRLTAANATVAGICHISRPAARLGGAMTVLLRLTS